MKQGGGQIVRIKYEPQDDRPGEANTPLGLFVPGEVRDIGDAPLSVRAAKTLVVNGDFVETEDDPNSDDVRKEYGVESAKRARLARREVIAAATGTTVANVDDARTNPVEPAVKAPTRARTVKRGRR